MGIINIPISYEMLGINTKQYLHVNTKHKIVESAALLYKIIMTLHPLCINRTDV